MTLLPQVGSKWEHIANKLGKRASLCPRHKCRQQLAIIFDQALLTALTELLIYSLKNTREDGVTRLARYATPIQRHPSVKSRFQAPNALAAGGST